MKGVAPQGAFTDRRSGRGHSSMWRFLFDRRQGAIFWLKLKALCRSTRWT